MTNLLTVSDVAAALKKSTTSVRRLITLSADDPKRLPAYRIGGSLRVRNEDLEAYVRSCVIAPVARRFSHRVSSGAIDQLKAFVR